jgi:hypothetical protein
VNRRLKLALELGAGFLVSLPLAIFSSGLALWQLAIVGLLTGLLIGAIGDGVAGRFGDR